MHSSLAIVRFRSRCCGRRCPATRVADFSADGRATAVHRAFRRSAARGRASRSHALVAGHVLTVNVVAALEPRPPNHRPNPRGKGGGLPRQNLQPKISHTQCPLTRTRHKLNTQCNVMKVLWLHTVSSVPVHKGRINQALAGNGLGNAACPFLPRGSQFRFDWLSTR